MKYDAYRSRLEHEERRSREDAARSAVQYTPVVEKPVSAADFNKSAGLSAPATPQIPPAASPEAPLSAATSSAYAPFSFQTLKPKQKKAFSLIDDLSHPDFMRPIEETANALYTADRKKRPKKAQDYVGYDFTKILQEALNDAGIPDENGIPLRIDGIFGPKTRTAYAQFQEIKNSESSLANDTFLFPAQIEPLDSDDAFYISSKPNFTPRKDSRKGSQNRQPTGERERNVGHPDAEEHSRTSKKKTGGTRGSNNGFVSGGKRVELQDIGKGLVVGAAAAGTGYLIYRGVRLLPSLLPPLWWTIPANLLAP